jgi:hypothetical protein
MANTYALEVSDTENSGPKNDKKLVGSYANQKRTKNDQGNLDSDSIKNQILKEFFELKSSRKFNVKENTELML